MARAVARDETGHGRECGITALGTSVADSSRPVPEVERCIGQAEAGRGKSAQAVDIRLLATAVDSTLLAVAV